jgi:hypothetical protein
MRIASDHEPGFANVLAVALPRCRQRCEDEREDVRRRERVEVFMANNFEAVTDHRMKRLRGVDQFARKFHRLALHAAPDAFLHR